MAQTIEIRQVEWHAEMETKTHPDALKAYLALERYIIDYTDLKVTYRRNLSGNSHHATFCASARGHCCVIQVLNGSCELIWDWKSKIPGASKEKHDAVRGAFDRFRRSLGGKKQGYEKVKVLSLGIERVQEAIKKVSDELNVILDDVAD